MRVRPVPAIFWGINYASGGVLPSWRKIGHELWALLLLRICPIFAFRALRKGSDNSRAFRRIYLRNWDVKAKEKGLHEGENWADPQKQKGPQFVPDLSP